MLDVVWLNILELAKLDVFSALLDRVMSSEKEWRVWCNSDTPEEEDIPGGYEATLDVFKYDNIYTVFIRLIAALE